MALPLLPSLLLLTPGLTSQMATLGLTQRMTTLGLTQQMAPVQPKTAPVQPFTALVEPNTAPVQLNTAPVIENMNFSQVLAAPGGSRLAVGGRGAAPLG